MQAGQLERFVFNIRIVAELLGPSGTICDIGGGWGTFSIGCAALGYRSILIDDFGDVGFLDAVRLSEINAVHRRAGVEVMSRDVVSQGIDLPSGSLDAITCFDAIEHFHHSPKRLLHSAMDALRPGGALVISTPNCANLRKRVAAAAGRVKWTSMHDWYEQERFRSHVREPDVEDLRYIGRDIGLAAASVLGRNWSGKDSSYALVRWLTAAADPLLRLRPSLCANIYLVGRKQPVTQEPSRLVDA
jgi:SAM-dependent methyltransferase